MTEAKTQGAVRSVRLPQHLWIDYEVIDLFGDELGPFGITAYTVLARHCYGGHRVTKPLRQLAADARMSKDSFARSLKRMVDLGLVAEQKGPTPKSAGSYDLMDVKELVKEMRALAKTRVSAGISVSHRDSGLRQPAPRPQHAPPELDVTNRRDCRGDAANDVLAALDGTVELEPSDLSYQPDNICLPQRQNVTEGADAPGKPENAPPAETDLSQIRALRETDLSLPASRSNTQETRNKKQEKPIPTLPAGKGAEFSRFPDVPEKTPHDEAGDESRWLEFKTQLKRQMHDIPLGVEAAKRWKGIEANAHDFTTCFAAWWLLKVERGAAGGVVFSTCAENESATEAGIQKYSKRLTRLARRVFNLDKDELVRFEVLRAPADGKTPNGHTANEAELRADHDEAQDLWERVKLELKESVAQLLKSDPRSRIDWYDDCVKPVELESVGASEGRPVWTLRSPVPERTKRTIRLFRGGIERIAGDVELVVLEKKGESP